VENVTELVERERDAAMVHASMFGLLTIVEHAERLAQKDRDAAKEHVWTLCLTLKAVENVERFAHQEQDAAMVNVSAFSQMSITVVNVVRLVQKDRYAAKASARTKILLAAEDVERCAQKVGDAAMTNVSTFWLKLAIVVNVAELVKMEKDAAMVYAQLCYQISRIAECAERLA